VLILPAMGTLENLSALAVDLRSTRERLESLAERAAELQRRLRTDAPTIVSLDKLAQERHPPLREPKGERFEGEETSLASDWEITLVSEEGK
jgi:hypothetical protein